MKKHIFLFCFSVMTLAGSSQVAGYQGKRFSFNYSGEFMNAVNNPNSNYENGWTCFNYRNEFQPEYTLSKKTSLCLFLKMQNSAFRYSRSVNYSSISGATYQELTFNPSESLFGDLKIKSYGIGLKIFTRDCIAPLGTYFKPEIYMLTYKVIEPIESKMADACVSYDYGAPANVPVIEFTNNSPYKMFSLGFEIGTNRILFNRLILSCGVNFGLVFNKEPNVEMDEDNYYSTIPQLRITNGSLISFKIGIGSLLF